jgi:predicted transcriptional regulator
MTKKRMTLADRIRDEIHRRGMTAYRLALVSGVSGPTAARFMRGDHDPSLSNVEKILDAIEWTVGPRNRSKQ